MKNLAADPEHRQKLDQMKKLLTEYLQSMDRPFGEFVPGGNAVAGGSIDKQIQTVKRIKISGKKVIVPEQSSLPKAVDRNNKRKQDRRERKRKGGVSK